MPSLLNCLVTVKSGISSSEKITKGDASKPISVHGTLRKDAFYKSSYNVSFNTDHCSLSFIHGLDNAGYSFSINCGNNVTKTLAFRKDSTKLKIGFEFSTTVGIDDMVEETSYTNVSITALGLAEVIIFATTGQGVPVPIPSE